MAGTDTSDAQEARHAAGTPALAGIGAAVSAAPGPAVVTGMDGAGAVRVDAGGGEVSALRAVSCLVEPAPGDTVLLARAGDRAFVLAVLERPVRPGEAPPARRIASAGPIEIEAPEVTVRAGTLSLVGRTVSLAGRLFTAVFRQSRRITGREEVRAVTRTVRADTQVVRVDGAERDHYGVHAIRVDGAATHAAQSTFFRAEADIRFDGERFTLS